MKTKKVLTIGIFFIGITTLVSCKKDWNCHCEGTIQATTYGVNGTTTTQNVNQDGTITDMKKPAAEGTCQDREQLFSNSNVSVPGQVQYTNNVKCELSPL